MFLGGTDGANPLTTPIVDSEGNIYGTTQAGGDRVVLRLFARMRHDLQTYAVVGNID